MRLSKKTNTNKQTPPKNHKKTPHQTPKNQKVKPKKWKQQNPSWTKRNSSASSFLLVDHLTSENFCTLSPILNCTSGLKRKQCKTENIRAEDVTLPIYIGCLTNSSYKLSESWRETMGAVRGIGLSGRLLQPLKSFTLTCWWRKTSCMDVLI